MLLRGLVDSATDYQQTGDPSGAKLPSSALPDSDHSRDAGAHMHKWRRASRAYESGCTNTRKSERLWRLRRTGRWRPRIQRSRSTACHQTRPATCLAFGRSPILTHPRYSIKWVGRAHMSRGVQPAVILRSSVESATDNRQTGAAFLGRVLRRAVSATYRDSDRPQDAER